jgi:hypothetical protein
VQDGGMKCKTTLVAAGTSTNDSPAEIQRTVAPQGFLSEAQLLELVPISRRTLSVWKSSGVIPFTKIGRRVLFRWCDVQNAILRRQRTHP